MELGSDSISAERSCTFSVDESESNQRSELEVHLYFLSLSIMTTHQPCKCIITTVDPTLIGMLWMNYYDVQYTFDIPHLLNYIDSSIPSTTIIIVDCKDAPIFPDDLEKIMEAQCQIILRGDNLPVPKAEQFNHIHLFPSAISDEELIKVINKLSSVQLTGDDPLAKPILIVEDNDDIREMYVITFRSKGYTVHEATDGLSGIARAVEINPAVIILDIMMPHMDGFEVLHTLKYNTSIRPIVIVNSNLE